MKTKHSKSWEVSYRNDQNSHLLFPAKWINLRNVHVLYQFTQNLCMFYFRFFLHIFVCRGTEFLMGWMTMSDKNKNINRDFETSCNMRAVNMTEHVCVSKPAWGQFLTVEICSESKVSWDCPRAILLFHVLCHSSLMSRSGNGLNV